MNGRVDLDEISMDLQEETNVLLLKVLEGFEKKGEEPPFAIAIMITLTTATKDVAIHIKAIDRHLLQ